MAEPDLGSATVYVAATLGVIHFYMRVKAGKTEPVIYGAILAALFAVRIYDEVRSRRKKALKAAKATAARETTAA